MRKHNQVKAKRKAKHNRKIRSLQLQRDYRSLKIRKMIP